MYADEDEAIILYLALLISYMTLLRIFRRSELVKLWKTIPLLGGVASLPHCFPSSNSCSNDSIDQLASFSSIQHF